MKRLLAGLLLVAVVGCGETDPKVAALEKLGVGIKRNE